MGDLSPEEFNAVAWLSLTDHELIERSASLGLPAELHPEGERVPGGRSATPAEVTQARANADAVAREWAGDVFVDAWIAANRGGEILITDAGAADF